MTKSRSSDDLYVVAPQDINEFADAVYDAQERHDAERTEARKGKSLAARFWSCTKRSNREGP